MNSAKRILFTMIPEKGHINPMIGPAVHLQRRGNSVRVYAPCDISEQLHRVGLVAIPSAANPSPPDANRGEFFAEKVRDKDWLRTWIKRLLVEKAPAQIEPIREAIRNFKPHVVVTDPMIYAAAIAAAKESVPWVAMSNSLNPVLDDTIKSDLLETVKWLAAERETLFAFYGLKARFSGCDMISPFLTIAFTTEEYVGRNVPGVHLVGPSLPPETRGDESSFPWGKLRDDRPVIYMSMGSQIYHQPKLFRKVIEATKGQQLQLVLAVNDLLGSSFLGELPNHVVACHYAPQLQLLPRVQAFITHGGANSVMEAIRFAVPLLISPVCNDQFHQAHFIERKNVGRVLDLSNATIEQCRETIHTILHDEAIHCAVKRVAASYQRDGAAEAASLIESLFA